MKFISPVSILELIMKNKEWLDWEPETIWRDIDNMYPNTPKGEPVFPDQFKDIIMALKLCFSNNMPWDQWNVFSQVVLAFNNQVPMFSVYVKPSLGQIAYAVYVMNKIKEEKFGFEISGFIASVAKDSGMLILPDILDFAKDDLALLNNKFSEKTKVAEAYWRLCSINGKLPEKGGENNFIFVQCAKVMAINKYVDSKILTHEEGNIVKLGNLIGVVNSSIIDLGSIASLGYSEYILTEIQHYEIAKYIHLNNRDMAIRSAREGLILTKYEINFRTMDDESIASSIENLTGKTADQIGAIYKKVYKAGRTRVARAVNRLSYGAGRIVSRIGGFLNENIFKRDKENK